MKAFVFRIIGWMIGFAIVSWCFHHDPVSSTAQVSGNVLGADANTEVVVLSDDALGAIKCVDLGKIDGNILNMKSAEDALVKWMMVLDTHKLAKVKCDASGHFICPVENSIKEPSRLFVATHTIQHSTIRFWVVPVELSSGSTNVSLAADNMFAHAQLSRNPADNFDTRSTTVSSKPELSPEQVAEIASNATAVVRFPNSFGSGFFIGQGLLVTNYHVISGNEQYLDSCTVLLSPQSGSARELKPSRILAVDSEHDLAILEVPNSDSYVPVLNLVSDQSKSVRGQTVYTYGSPAGWEGTFSVGIISALREEQSEVLRSLDYTHKVAPGSGEIIQFTAPIGKGNSGGPLMNTRGEVIGVTFASANGPVQNLNLAISAKFIRELVDFAKSPAQPSAYSNFPYTGYATQAGLR